MNDDRVLLALDDPIATITLNRPDKLNALEPAMLDRLEAIVRQLDRDPGIRVVLLTATGDRAFCVGADITAWSALEPLDMWRRWVRDGHRVFDAFARLRQPTIAVLNGYTFGGGLELALAADLRLAAAGIELAAPEVKIGTLPGWGGTKRLTQLIGVARTKQLVFTGARIDAATAERWGLVNDVVPRDQLMSRARAIADEIAANAPISVQLAKQAIDGGLGENVVVALEAIAGALAATTEDGCEGVASFEEKRPARFIGS
jgi:enoyl-CoA hydratase/carnithine racemase